MGEASQGYRDTARLMQRMELERYGVWSLAGRWETSVLLLSQP